MLWQVLRLLGQKVHCCTSYLTGCCCQTGLQDCKISSVLHVTMTLFASVLSWYTCNRQGRMLQRCDCQHLDYHTLTLQVRDCGSLLTVGGFNIPAVDVDDITIHYKDFKGVVNHIRYSLTMLCFACCPINRCRDCLTACTSYSQQCLSWCCLGHHMSSGLKMHSTM